MWGKTKQLTREVKTLNNRVSFLMEEMTRRNNTDINLRLLINDYVMTSHKLFESEANLMDLYGERIRAIEKQLGIEILKDKPADTKE